MPTSITFNGSTYSVPSYGDTGWAQGAGNLSSYLVAIAAGTLQTTGGSFTLSAPIDFGGTFGLLAAYYSTKSASPATAGVLRLAIGDTIDWGVGNLALSVSGTTLMWNGQPIPIGSLTLPLAIASGGTGQTTQQAALDALAGAVTSGSYLRGNGTHVVMSAIQAGDVPTLNQNTTGTATNITASSNSTLTTLSSLSLPGSQVTGAVSSATSSTNIAGGVANDIPYQTGAGATSFIAAPGANVVLAGNSGAPAWSNAPTFSAANLTSFPTLNQNTTGTAAIATAANGLKSATTTVSVSGATAPTSGQVLTATSSTAATWQDAGGLFAMETQPIVVVSGNSGTTTLLNFSGSGVVNSIWLKGNTGTGTVTISITVDGGSAIVSNSSGSLTGTNFTGLLPNLKDFSPTSPSANEGDSSFLIQVFFKTSILISMTISGTANISGNIIYAHN